MHVALAVAEGSALRNIILTTNSTIRPLVESWVGSLKADGKSQRTLEIYASAVRSLTAWSNAEGLPMNPVQQTPDQLRRYVAAQLEGESARASVVLR